MVKRTFNAAGFTLVELLAGTTIFAIIMASLLLMLNSFEATGDMNVTRQRMETIATKAGEYYLSREDLPVPVATAVVAAPMGEVPLTSFHLDSKYRIDAWGRPMQYFSVRNDGNNGRPGQILIDPLSAGAPAGSPAAMVDIPQADLTPPTGPPTGKTLITGVQVEGQVVAGVVVGGRQVAGVLISSGPNNVFEYTLTPGTAGPPATLVRFTLDAGSDDIILPIDLTPQATRIARTELKKLGEKARAFDDRYIGKDNDGNSRYDEDNCAAINYPGAGIRTRFIGDRARDLTDPNDPAALTLECRNFPRYRAAGYLPVDNNDYSCGLPSLDAMKDEYCDISLGLGNCPLGYYVSNELQRDYLYTRVSPIPVIPPPPLPPPVQWIESVVDCGYIGADYFRVPMVRGNPAPDNCHWGLVGNPALDPEEVTNDQARGFIFCVYGLSPADIIDPWLNGYPWGSATDYSDPDPRFNKFFSAGPNITDPDDDIVAPL